MNTWRNCSSCKKPILFEQRYKICSVSTCNRARTGFVFCSTACWDAHVPVMNHRESWCEDARAPKEEPARPAPSPSPPTFRAAPPPPQPDGRRRIAPTSAPEPEAAEVLIVASRLKQYISDRADMNTSADVLEVLSEIVRVHTDAAIARARADGRKTVKARDYEA